MPEDKYTNEEHPKDEPIRLFDEDDTSLTLVNNHVEGRDDGRNLALTEDEKDERTFEEETAAEYGAFTGMDAARDVEDEGRATAGSGLGAFALVLSILSLFLMPIFLGITGIIVGFISRRNGARGLGNWAIGIGALSILMTVFFSPFL